MSINKKFLSIAIVVAIVIGLVFSAAFVIENSDHNCTGIECQICDQIQFCLKTIIRMFTGAEIVLVAIAALIITHSLFVSKELIAETITLTEYKTKLSN